MSPQNEGLLAWLDRAITEHEETARKATSGVCPDWIDSAVRHIARNCQVDCTHEDHQDWDQPEWDRYVDSPHIILHSPESVLRRCAADRKLLNLHGGRGHSCPAHDYDGDLDDNARFYNHEVCPVVQHLADGYGWTAGQTPPIEGDPMT